MTRLVCAAVSIAAVISLSSAPLQAGNPVINTANGPGVWDTAGPVVWNPDGGVLGKLGNTAANQMVDDSFDAWQNVSTAVITFGQGGQVVDDVGTPVDVTSANYNAIINLQNGQNPIIYDNGRDIFNALGIPCGVVGFAGPLFRTGLTITKGRAVLQGAYFNDTPANPDCTIDPGELDENTFRGMIVHELGHMIGLAHSTVNGQYTSAGIPGCPPANGSQIETMNPTLFSGALTPHNDDEMILSFLYPSAAFDANFAKLSGTVFDRDASAFDGANVELRLDTGDCNTRYADAQAIQSGAELSQGAGSYLFPGLTPSANYTLYVTDIVDGGEYPIAPPALGAPSDWYDSNEAYFNPPDNPSTIGTIAVGAAGSTTANIDMRLNNAGDPGQASSLTALELDGTTPSGPPTQQILENLTPISAQGFGGTAQAAWINRFSPAPADLPLQIEKISLLFWESGSLAPGRAIRLLVYQDAGGTGNPANATLVYTEDTTIQMLSTSEFNEYTLATPVLINSGDYYVGAFDLVADAGTTFIRSYDTDATPGPSYSQANSTAPASYADFNDGIFHIRAETRFVPPAGSVQLDWSAACNLGTVPDQDYGVYQGSLAALPSYDHAPVVCTTNKQLTEVVPNPPSDQFFMVAPVLATKEGSLATASSGGTRTPAVTCQTVDADACP